MTTQESVTPSSGSLFQRLRRQSVLRRQAHQDYQRARGTIHREMLQASLKRVQSETKAETQHIKDTEAGYKRTTQVSHQELEKILIQHLVQHELSQVPGIGPKLRSGIISGVFRGRLSDLHQAYRIQGIGSRRQQDISRWVRRREAELPHLLHQDFPGKSRVLAAYQEDLDTFQTRIETARERVAELQELERQIESALETLDAVTWRDFYQAMLDHTKPSEHLLKYIVGVFAAWEPMPEWFRRAMAIQKE